MCLNGLDMLCSNGGIDSAITNGGFAEYIAVPQRNVLRIPDNIDWEIAKSSCNYFNAISCTKGSFTTIQ